MAEWEDTAGTNWSFVEPLKVWRKSAGRNPCQEIRTIYVLHDKAFTFGTGTRKEQTMVAFGFILAT